MLQIKFLNNLLLAYTQEFSLAVFISSLKTLKQSIIIVQGVNLVSCYSIYKVHLLAAANFDILSHNFSFVKNFFQVFSNFFSLCSFLPRSLERLGILAYTSPFVNTFFQLFSTFFNLLQIVVGAPRFPQDMRLPAPLSVQNVQTVTFPCADPTGPAPDHAIFLS